MVVQQRGELANLERQYAAKLSVYKPQWPEMVELKARIDQARKGLEAVTGRALADARDAARSEYQTALRQEQSLIDELARAKNENRQLNSAAVEYTNLQIEISTKRTLLNELMKNQSQTDVSSRLQATRESNVRVVDRALVPGAPFRPSLRRNLTAGLGSGLLAGIALVFFLHYLDRTLKSPEELERVLGLPLLATIPERLADRQEGALRALWLRVRLRVWLRLRPEKAQGAVRQEPGGFGGRGADRAAAAFAAAARGLRGLPHPAHRAAAVDRARAQGDPGHLGGARRGEDLDRLEPGGRPLAAAEARPAGRRRPAQAARARHLRRLEPRGAGQAPDPEGRSVEKIVFQTKIPNLWIVPSGPIPPNPSELLASERMREFLEWAKSHFDLVIVDSAPTLAVTDAIIAGKLADGVVLCLRAGYVQRRDAIACRDRLAQSEVRILGAVLNCHELSYGRYRKGYAGAYAYEAYGASSEEPGKKVAAL